MQLSAFAIAVLAALSTHDVSAVGCTPDQKQQMLDAITTHPSWPACQQATEPFDFFLALTQQGPKPTANDLAKFQAAAPCNTVYASFQDAIKRANCDEIAELVGVPADQLVPAAAPSTATPRDQAAALSPAVPAKSPRPMESETLAPPRASVASSMPPKSTVPAVPAATTKVMDKMTGKKMQPPSSLAATSASLALSAIMAAIVVTMF
ncbi:hypothetical protein H257_14875 [Aphanomyces astaci]|uniref:Secreted protein n=1 Tax=Aphanomyces astaci TaxID=112090 RepID=W4FPX1_APHAT|nr:hypothetical protein H257_14875 [Aphanomyces astaci]ETV69510.1 hypothetical protein H257_14875 [Aphanomyces astaci]|eukprot:XP_009841083.1 hypothetical protein H257_14875 [Aphanomyces astaci]